MNDDENRPQSPSRRGFFAAAAVGGAALATLARMPRALAAGASNVITVGAGGDRPDLASAVDGITGSSASNGYHIKLLPGVHALPPGGLTLPPYVVIEGSGQTITEIACIDGDVLRVASGCKLARLTLSGDFDAASSQSGILVNGASSVVNLQIEDVDMYVTGGYGAALRLLVGDNVCFMRNVNVYTTSVGLDVRGYFYVNECNVFLSGNGTGTPYYGVYAGGKLRMYVWGTKIGTGYGRTDRAGFDPYLEVKNDASSNVVAIFIPQSNTQDPRIECDGLNSYARNELTTSTGVQVCCVRAEAGRVRLYGGLLQAETPANGAVRESLFQSGTGIIETFGVRWSSSAGNIWGTNNTGSSQMTAADHNRLLSDESGGIILCDASAGPFTLRLPGYFAGFRNGIRMAFIKTDTSANAVTISGTGLTINGQATRKLTTAYEKIEVFATTNAWLLL